MEKNFVDADTDSIIALARFNQVRLIERSGWLIMERTDEFRKVAQLFSTSSKPIDFSLTPKYDEFSQINEKLAGLLQGNEALVSRVQKL